MSNIFIEKNKKETLCGTGHSANKTARLATRMVYALVSRPPNAIGGAYH